MVEAVTGVSTYGEKSVARVNTGSVAELDLVGIFGSDRCVGCESFIGKINQVLSILVVDRAGGRDPDRQIAIIIRRRNGKPGVAGIVDARLIEKAIFLNSNATNRGEVGC